MTYIQLSWCVWWNWRNLWNKTLSLISGLWLRMSLRNRLIWAAMEIKFQVKMWMSSRMIWRLKKTIERKLTNCKSRLKQFKKIFEDWISTMWSLSSQCHLWQFYQSSSCLRLILWRKKKPEIKRLEYHAMKRITADLFRAEH